MKKREIEYPAESGKNLNNSRIALNGKRTKVNCMENFNRELNVIKDQFEHVCKSIVNELNRVDEEVIVAREKPPIRDLRKKLCRLHRKGPSHLRANRK